jgi:poly-beta-1,6-N-acetyl-D-glucosamine synthase
VKSAFRPGKESSVGIPAYVLITPAHNEEAFIEQTIESVLRQSILPTKWVVVDDGSTDKTSEIVKRHLPANAWMALIERPKRRDRSFANKADAVNAAFETVKCLEFEVIGNLDADVSFTEDHFEFLLSKFPENPGLGVVGAIFNEDGYRSDADSFAGRKHVWGGCQLFRRQCWEEIGGYSPHRAGGVDWIAVTTARMKGWQTETFRERPCWHHRKMGTAYRSPVGAAFSRGKQDYYLGGHPLWEIFRVGYRCMKRPYLVGGIALGCGYLFSLLRGAPRPVSRELVAFHRKEQMAKLGAIVESLARFKRPDGFNLERG